MARTRGSRRGSPHPRERLELVRDGLVVARHVFRRNEPVARRELRRARRELQIVLRALAPRRELAPLLAPLLALLLELGGLAATRD